MLPILGSQKDSVLLQFPNSKGSELTSPPAHNSDGVLNPETLTRDFCGQWPMNIKKLLELESIQQDAKGYQGCPWLKTNDCLTFH